MSKIKLRRNGIKKHWNKSSQRYIIGYDFSSTLDYSCILLGRQNKQTGEMVILDIKYF